MFLRPIARDLRAPTLTWMKSTDRDWPSVCLVIRGVSTGLAFRIRRSMRADAVCVAPSGEMDDELSLRRPWLLCKPLAQPWRTKILIDHDQRAADRRRRGMSVIAEINASGKKSDDATAKIET